jgi:hypothetical protein
MTAAALLTDRIPQPAVFKLLKLKRLTLIPRQAVIITRQKSSRRYGRQHILTSGNCGRTKSEILVSSPFKKEFQNKQVIQVNKNSKTLKRTNSQPINKQNVR